MECTNELQLEHARLLATMQSQIETMITTLSDFSVIRETLVKLTILNEQEIKFTERQMLSNDKFAETLEKINESQNKMNSHLSNLTLRVTSLETTKEQEVEAKTELVVEGDKVKANRFNTILTLYGVIIVAVLGFIEILIQLDKK